MSTEPFIGEIKLFGGNFEIRGYMYCSGQILSIAQNTALFSLLGTTYGGNGQTTFALPDLRGRIPMNQGQGPGLSNRVIGQSGGAQQVTLTTATLPAHSHVLSANSGTGNSGNPAGAFWAAQPSLLQYAPSSTGPTMKATALTAFGGSQPHDNMVPYLGINYLIATEGIFPSRN